MASLFVVPERLELQPLYPWCSPVPFWRPPLLSLEPAVEGLVEVGIGVGTGQDLSGLPPLSSLHMR